MSRTLLAPLFDYFGSDEGWNVLFVSLIALVYALVAHLYDKWKHPGG